MNVSCGTHGRALAFLSATPQICPCIQPLQKMQEIASLRHHRRAKATPTAPPANSSPRGGPHSKKHCTSQSVCLIDFSSSKSQTSVANLIENPQVKFRRAGLSCAWARPEQTWIAAEVEHSLVSQPCRGFRKGGWDCVLEACPKEYYRPANSRTSVLCQGPSSENGSLHGRHAWDIQMPSASIK